MTTQITDTLIRFRQGKEAFVADIEKMFFQVLVSTEHRSLFRTGKIKHMLVLCT